MSTVRVATSAVVVFLLLLGLVAVVQHYAFQMSGIAAQLDDGFAVQLARYREHSTMEFLHLVPAFVFFMIAPFQFVGRIRKNHPRVHRVLGRTYVAVGLISGVLGIVLSIVMPFGGTMEAILVLPFGLFFLYAVSRGFLHARARRIQQHRQWMIRGLALALAISVQRVFLGILMIDRPLAEMSEMFNVAILSSFIACVAAAELYIRYVPQRTA